jgi:hypothetical protein
MKPLIHINIWYVNEFFLIYINTISDNVLKIKSYSYSFYRVQYESDKQPSDFQNEKDYNIISNGKNCNIISNKKIII